MDGVRAHHEANRRGWNQGAEAYEAEAEAAIEFLRSGGQNFCTPELPFLDRLETWCGRAIHLQCAGGTDTLSLWNRGAREVVGIDISDRMIECARRKSKALGARALWFRCDVLDSPPELDGTADLVYTGRGALCWIMDLEAWAAVVARLLKPGGRMYVYEGHPFAELWDSGAATYQLDRDYGDYFSEQPIDSVGWPTTYIGDLGRKVEEHAPKYERMWRLGQVVNAVLGAGLRLLRLDEHPETFWDVFPNMSPDLVRRLPQTYSLLASKPEN